MTSQRPDLVSVVPSCRRGFRAPRAAALAACAILAALAPALAQAPTVTTAAVAVPPELAPEIAATLAPDVVTVTTGTTKLEFWWVKSLPVTAASGASPSWADVAEGSLVGVLRLGSSWQDIRGFTVRPGVYTLRLALQPQDGDHMGMSPHREFLMPGPAADDKTLPPVGYDGAVDLAKKASRRAHPASIAIDPPETSATPLGTTTNDLGHQVVVMRVPTTGAAPLTFGLVVEGTIEH